VRRCASRNAALAVAILLAGALPAEDGVLFWMVDSSAQVTPQGGGTATGLQSFLGSYEAVSGSSFAARVRVTGGDISGDTFLDLYNFDGSTYSGTYGIEIEDMGGYWGAGVPDGNQSPVSAYSAGSPEYSFIVEIGNIYNDSWTTVAQSSTVTYSLLAEYIQPTFSIDPGSLPAWTPQEFTAVPEPSGGLLMAMGLAILALQRKRSYQGRVTA